MAIQRCPYCKAIIDEGAEYCTNCGTKLLFPEDDFIEEEIPGEKLINLDDDMDEATDDEHKDLDLEPPGDEENLEAEKSFGEDSEEDDAGEDSAQELESGEDDLGQAAPEDQPSGQEEHHSRKRRRRFKRKSSPKKEKEEIPVEIVDDIGSMEAEDSSDEIKEAVAAAPAEPVFDGSELMPDLEAEQEVREELESESEPRVEPEADDQKKAAEAIGEDEWNLTGAASEPAEEAAEEALVDEQAAEDSDKAETRHGLTDDLPDHFAQALDEARERAGEPLEAPAPSLEAEEEPEELFEGKPQGGADEEALEPEPGTAEEKEWQTPPPVDDELTPKPDPEESNAVQTDDIKEIVDEAEKEKEEIEAFIASVKKERQAFKSQTPADTQDVPPWVEGVEKGPLPDIPPTDEIESRQQETEGDAAGELDSTPPSEEIPRDPSIPGYDTRSAFPETVDQQGLPFVAGTQEVEEQEIAEEKSTIAEEPVRKSKTPRRKTQPLGFGDWIKARIFDILFVTALWFVAMWIASQVLEASVFRIITGAVPLALSFLALLLLIYFFFFLFFLGETLGNYLFFTED